jgi:dihydrofolate synthase/folylpolyglutamate synthase
MKSLPGARPNCPVITVGGTNGKGSVVAMLEAIYGAAGYRTMAYTSPHLLDFNERIRVNRRPVGDEAVVSAFNEVEGCRGSVALTYFEHVTLAALRIAALSRPDVMLLEVGLGGRLDAVNAVDADLAIITSIGLDHVEWLGGTRGSIAREKAGIARPERPLIVGERRPPRGWIDELEAGQSELLLAGRDFCWRRAGARMRFYRGQKFLDVPPPSLAGRHQWSNAACAVMAALALQARLPVPHQAIAEGLADIKLPGRLQKVSERPEIWLDVAHNAQSARVLGQALGSSDCATTAVYASLAGKDVAAIGKALADRFESWLIPPLKSDRSVDPVTIQSALRSVPVEGGTETVESMPKAIDLALERTPPNGRIVVFGSFLTVADAWPLIQHRE